ncbi:MAG: preprotein translocase subunit YajC [Mucilaginibacter sp.]|uniref:preprotein translocase subunit YajC n=1 Tax=Mucilaginibacter sp. TaxID=1882438 RepID=UPI003267149B
MTINTLLQIGGLSQQYTQYIMFGLIFLVFYFFMIRPQIKKQKDQKKYVEELKKGDKVVTTAGIHGKIVDISDAFVVIDVDKGVNIKFDKAAISLEASKALNAATKA